MADDPFNQQQFAEDVAAAAAEALGEGATYSNLGSLEGDFKLPSVDEVWKLIEQMEDISDEEREKLRDSLYNPQDGSPEDFAARYTPPELGPSTWDYLIFISMITIIVLVFALFGYKLYKSLMEKELKKKEKVKNKQSKKSKKAN